MHGNRERTLSAAQQSRTTPSSEFLACLAKWMLVFNRVYRQPMMDAAIWAYRETLCDLSVEELDRGCIGAMKATKFTPTPAEIREYGILPREDTPLNALPPAPPITDAEAKEFFDRLKAEVPCLSAEAKQRDGVIVITEEMRAEQEQKKQKALARFAVGGQ